MTDGERLAHWLAGGDCGVSSKTIALRMCGVANRYDERRFGSHPRDPDDFGRCARLLALYPEWRARLSEVMPPVSEEWRRLVARWDEITAAMAEEVGLAWEKGRSAPRTYRLMQSIIRGEA